MTGRNGRDLRIPVPCGTVVRNQETGEVLGEILTDGQTLRVAQGGQGGLGNLHFVSSTNRTPRQFTPGGENQVLTLRLELKLIAQVGLVGYPNAGKSTLIRQISRAHPKVASYPFTTLHPVLGVITFSDYRTVRIADLPGLIEGAHAGVGLGHAFLRHIERTELLVFVLDCAGVDGRTPQADYEHLLDELGRHEADLLHRPRLLVANKMDLPGAEDLLADFSAATGTQPIPISARDGAGLEALRAAIETHFFPPADQNPAAGIPDEIPS